LILDEPAASLDPMGRHDVLTIMERLRKYTTVFYSTHILDDVQRVSDTVAILNHGQLIAKAPIQELLSGNDGGTIFMVTLKGGTEEIQNRVSSQPWVQNLGVDRQDDQTLWSVCVSDPEKAEKELLRLILEDRDVVVKSFNRKVFNLEEVFLSLIEGSK